MEAEIEVTLKKYKTPAVTLATAETVTNMCREEAKKQDLFQVTGFTLRVWSFGGFPIIIRVI